MHEHSPRITATATATLGTTLFWGNTVDEASLAFMLVLGRSF